MRTHVVGKAALLDRKGSAGSLERTSGCLDRIEVHHQPVVVGRTVQAPGQLAGNRSVEVEDRPSDVASFQAGTGQGYPVAGLHLRYGRLLDGRALHPACAHSLLPFSSLSVKNRTCISKKGLFSD